MSEKRVIEGRGSEYGSTLNNPDGTYRDDILFWDFRGKRIRVTIEEIEENVKTCSSCYWEDFIDDDEPENDPCRHCFYDPNHYNWKALQ